jgi:hypothetical protein
MIKFFKENNNMTPKEQQSIKDLIECTTPETAYKVENYPYGFSARTTLRAWIETNKGKQRYCTQTLNPKTHEWNKPKYSTYSDIMLMYLRDENGHLDTFRFSIQWSDEKDDEQLLNALGDFRNEYIEKKLKLLSAVRNTQKHITVTIGRKSYKHKVTGEIVQQVDIFELDQYDEMTDEEHEKEQQEVKKNINRLFAINLNKEGLKVSDLKEK